jgi:NTE family protein
MTAPTLRAHLEEAPFQLAMSSGFFGFFAHAGMLSALVEEGLAPASACGSSAGALVAAAWAAGVESAAFADVLTRLKRADFWDPAPGLGLLRGDRFRTLIEDLFPEKRFEDTRAPLAVSTFDVIRRRTHVVTSGRLAPAVVASCAVPFLFHPVRHEGRLLLDGGIRDRPGLAGARTGRTLFHHLASRSPWRLPGDPALAVPTRPELVTLVIDGLPRASPHSLPPGVRAMALARDATKRALDRALTNGVVREAA